MTQPLSGESSVLDTCLISDGFFLFQQRREQRARSKEEGMTGVVNRQSRIVNRIGHTHEHQIRASRLVVRRRMVFCERSWLARMKRTVRLSARIKIEWVTAVAPWDRTPRKSALSLMPVAQKTMFFPLARSSAE